MGQGVAVSLPRRIRAVVTDVDGTIVGSEGTPSDATVHAVASLRVRRIALVVATARTPAGVAALGPLRPHITIAVCCTGAIGWFPHRDEVLWQHVLDPSVVNAVVEFVASELPGGAVAAYDGQRWITTDNYLRVRGATPRGPVQSAPSVDITRVHARTMAICHPDLDAGHVAALLRARIPDLPATLAHATPELLDINPAGSDKATGVARALAILGIDPSDTIGFGDMPNDLPMLALVGHPVAVGNAHPDVIALAATVTAAVDDDGFARALDSLKIIAGPRGPDREAPAEPTISADQPANVAAEFGRHGAQVFSR